MGILAKLTIIIKADDVVITESGDVELWSETLAKIQAMEKKSSIALANAAIDESTICPECNSTNVKSVCMNCKAEWGY